MKISSEEPNGNLTEEQIGFYLMLHDWTPSKRSRGGWVSPLGIRFLDVDEAYLFQSDPLEYEGQYNR